MDKEKIMQKLKIKNYNKELEELLLRKDFSKNTKNLLSSMLYKIENSYEDYKKIKIEVPSKKEVLEELIEIISRDCKKIELEKLNSEDGIIPKEKKSIIIKEEQKIVTYQNELALLKAIYGLNTNKFNEISGDLCEKAFFTALNEGEIATKSEILRDFDGWAWNILTLEIEGFIPNLIYQSMVYLLGYKILNQNKQITINEIEVILKEKYKTVSVENIMKFVTRLAIVNYINQRPEEQKNLKDMETELQKTLELMEDKKKYIEEITKQKKKHVKEIERIDKYLNDDLALKKEYIEQNQQLPQEQRVFSLSDFSENMQEKRNVLKNEIKILTERLKPQNFVKEKIKLEKNLDDIKDVNLKNIEDNIQDFINSVLKIMNLRINKISTKKEIADQIYILRYIKMLYINKDKTVGSLCKKQFEKIEKNLITIGCNLKALNIFSKNVNENYKIYKNIFNTKIIDLESAYIEIGKENVVKIYDENSVEKEEKFTEFKELSVRYDKKTRIFI